MATLLVILPLFKAAESSARAPHRIIIKRVHVGDGVDEAAVGSFALAALCACGGGGAREARIIAAHGVGKRRAGVLRASEGHSTMGKGSRNSDKEGWEERGKLITTAPAPVALFTIGHVLWRYRLPHPSPHPSSCCRDTKCR
jgi:hypothetical protein